MTEFWTAAVTFSAGILAAIFWVRSRRARSLRHAALRAGDIVFVRTPDKKRLLARVISRGVSHFWIELAPGDARWWVPASAVEGVPQVISDNMNANDRISRSGWRRVSVARDGERGREWV